MLRGGSWNNNANNCRSSNRNRNNPDNRNNNNGFRCVSPVSLKAGNISGKARIDPAKAGPSVQILSLKPVSCPRLFLSGQI
ncbi:MAG: hypothetical protein COY53_03320 [Elusimicrobia bacterium CG_4_10_14_0_8_um_filter_37_32]|nr:MAG: hypothetical protein COS17_03285 [Elusimicrobia bacterium CG02_land_8_20_14_3_00_37_13]PIZ13734.1 MAG: hypothetical protein COY53_03320 [Elusimicrobia bacterium CG_4_10_14_0_8_um_filter_37_32]